MKLFGYVLILFVLFLSLKNTNKKNNKQSEKFDSKKSNSQSICIKSKGSERIDGEKRDVSWSDVFVHKEIGKFDVAGQFNVDTEESWPYRRNWGPIPKNRDSENEEYVGGGSGGSDIRLKKNIKKLQNSLEKIEKINGVQFNWKDNKLSKEHNEIGFIAQEIQKEYPELIYKLSKDDKSEDPLLGVDYPKFTAILLEGLKELNNRVKLLENKN